MDKRFFYSTKTATGDTNCLNVNSVLVFVFSNVFHVARKSLATLKTPEKGTGVVFIRSQEHGNK